MICEYCKDKLLYPNVYQNCYHCECKADQQKILQLEKKVKELEERINSDIEVVDWKNYTSDS